MPDLTSTNVTVTVTASALNPKIVKKNKEVDCTIAFGDGALTYPSGGVPMPAFTSFGLKRNLDRLELYDPANANGFVYKYDVTNNKVRIYQTASVTPAGTISTPTFTGAAYAGSTVDVTDDDSADSNGVAIYLHLDEVMEQGMYLGHLEFVSPTNADGSGTVNNGGPGYLIQDDDAAASGGFQIYFDEDGANADERFLANITGAHDAFVMLDNGEMLRINYDASADSNGVAVYFDEDAANSYARLLFISPTNAAGVGATDDTVTMESQTPSGTVSQPTLTGAATTAAALSEFSGAPAATTLKAIAIGW